MKPGTFLQGRLGYVLIASLAVALAPLLVLAQETKPTVAEQASAKLPEAKEIIAQYIEAMGGEDALLKTVSKHIVGSVSGQAGEGTLEIFRHKPNKLLIRVNAPGIGEIVQGYDGKVGYSANPMHGAAIVQGSRLAQLSETADFYTELHRASKFKSMETVELTEFEGRPCYKVKIVSKAGREYAEFFDAETGLLVGNLGEQELQGTTVEQITVFSDYKTFGDLLLPTRTVVRIMGFEQVMTYDRVEFNTVDEAVYELPEDVKALVSAEPSTGRDEN